MLIHAYCRKEPIVVELFGGLIKFELNDRGDVVAPVEDKPSIDRLLSISEGYREYDREATPQAPAPAAPLVMARPAWLQDEIEVGDDIFASGDAVLQSAFDAADVNLEAWNAMPASDRDALVQAEIDRRKAAVQTTDEDDEAQIRREEEEQAARIAAAEQEKAEAAKSAPEDAGQADPLVLFNDKTGETLDIGKLTAKQVRAMAAEQDPPIELPAGNSTPVAELRLLLAKGLKGE
ncbi:hypothetical protein GCM10007320_08660 [Pseudorhodoferax aquiterrae]|uniref:PRTRC genetic system protein E n=1 Tax=Pseudorhodoferax aquiterrae TaxID=747304 RepID=A0ABQ3FX38_9BURK|nr:hypothetical protein [Pseudorhodoferax aquiterrae]GHC72646.1 hypothetical protein GCM10007320_08660 [Pseudorhodoferax aquiterrae]